MAHSEPPFRVEEKPTFFAWGVSLQRPRISASLSASAPTGEFLVFLPLRSRLARLDSRVLASLRFIAHGPQKRRIPSTTTFRQSRQHLFASLPGAANSSGHSFSLGPKKRAVSSNFIANLLWGGRYR